MSTKSWDLPVQHSFTRRGLMHDTVRTIRIQLYVHDGFTTVKIILSQLSNSPQCLLWLSLEQANILCTNGLMYFIKSVCQITVLHDRSHMQVCNGKTSQLGLHRLN